MGMRRAGAGRLGAVLRVARHRGDDDRHARAFDGHVRGTRPGAPGRERGAAGRERSGGLGLGRPPRRVEPRGAGLLARRRRRAARGPARPDAQVRRRDLPRRRRRFWAETSSGALAVCARPLPLRRERHGRAASVARVEALPKDGGRQAPLRGPGRLPLLRQRSRGGRDGGRGDQGRVRRSASLQLSGRPRLSRRVRSLPVLLWDGPRVGRPREGGRAARRRGAPGARVATALPAARRDRALAAGRPPRNRAQLREQRHRDLDAVRGEREQRHRDRDAGGARDRDAGGGDGAGLKPRDRQRAPRS
mmetsp:Transcript_31893/g.98507  ORF Transcript_31893/g.98507 Transcript_31893/m.98507 type:complete len:305 (-) Transcript_31893:14-928(-)